MNSSIFILKFVDIPSRNCVKSAKKYKNKIYIYLVTEHWGPLFSMFDPDILFRLKQNLQLLFSSLHTAARAKNDAISTGLWCTSVLFRLVAPPLNVLKPVALAGAYAKWMSWRHEPQLRLYLCISRSLQCRSTGIPRRHRRDCTNVCVVY